MIKTLCSSKIHRATVTAADLNYIGSITVDKTLMDAANIVQYEKVQIVNINNGARFETYTIVGEANSGTICLNGAASRVVSIGDLVIIIAYAMITEHECSTFKPSVVHVNHRNQIISLENSIEHNLYEAKPTNFETV